jgi:hypothetical protein
MLLACSSSSSGDGSGADGDWIEAASQIAEWDCFNEREFDDSMSTQACTCRPGFSSDQGDNAPFCFRDHPCCILHRGSDGTSVSCECRAWFLVTDEPSRTDQQCDLDATGDDRVRVDDCPVGAE